MKSFASKVVVLMAALMLSLGMATAAEKPKSVIHVVTIKWKDGTTPEQITKALQAFEAASNTYKGVTRVWTRAIKVQGQGYTHAVVMEFASEQALKDYAGSDAQKKLYEVYLPIRGQSTTHDITN
jgi:hypothetical protein